MPRKAKPGPQVLYVEVLGEDGPQAVGGVEVSFVDDFTGEVVPVARTQVGRARVGVQPEQVHIAQVDEDLRAKRELLEAIGILPKAKPEAKLVAPKVKGMRPVREITLGGQRYSLQVEKKPWRRV